jgi:hypothetical protein
MGTRSFLAISILLNALVLFSIPNFVVPPALNGQREKALVNLLICLIPLFFSVFAVVRMRGRPWAPLRWLMLLPALYWVVFSVDIFMEAFAS